MQRFILVVLLILSGLTVYSEEIIEPEEEHATYFFVPELVADPTVDLKYPLDWFVGEWMCVQNYRGDIYEWRYETTDRDEYFSNDYIKISCVDGTYVVKQSITMTDRDGKPFVRLREGELKGGRLYWASGQSFPEVIFFATDGRYTFDVGENQTILQELAGEWEEALYQQKELYYGSKVNDSGVRIRSEPNLNGEVYGKLNKGDKVMSIEKSVTPEVIDGESWYWYKVKSKNFSEGWVYGKYLDIDTSSSPYHEK
ncbi:MAG: SH3 domain-containing protein [Treponema sp.]|nr:SH3 domain-containing protein [Spirochaetia bacterium]MDD7275532.1 SH3 domain-containing protein [Treponema sp.]MDY3755050.1 SH3 domain-containing protein [Treponema sp.]